MPDARWSNVTEIWFSVYVIKIEASLTEIVAAGNGVKIVFFVVIRVATIIKMLMNFTFTALFKITAPCSQEKILILI